MVKISLKGIPIKEITIKGHAGYDESGKDIVCAALSSIVITSVNAIIRIDNEAIDYEDKNGIKKIEDKNTVHQTEFSNC